MACDVIAWEVAGSSVHAFRILCGAHRNTWFSVEGLRWIVTFSAGTAAGTLLADMIFCVGISCCMSLIDERIRASDLDLRLPAEGASDFWQCDLKGAMSGGMAKCSHASYVDDNAYPGRAVCTDVLSKIGATIAIVYDCLSALLFDTNMGHGKTESILRIAGPGADEVKITSTFRSFQGNNRQPF